MVERLRLSVVTFEPDRAHNRFLDAALRYAGSGTPVYPTWPRHGDQCGCGDRGCKSPGKHPIGRLVPNGLKDATKDKDTIRRWWRAYPDAGIGAPTGSSSGLLVIDSDLREGHSGTEALSALAPTLGPLPETHLAGTPSGGRHLYFKYPEGIGCSQGALGPLVDVKGEGGAIVLPPSHDLYRWLDDRQPAELPPAWIDRLRGLKARPRGSYIAADVIKRLAELAMLDVVSYERKRKGAAGELGLRTPILDQLVEERRDATAKTAATGEFGAVEPWPDPVDGDKLLDTLQGLFGRHIVMSKAAAAACALWTIFAYAHDAGTHSPILAIAAPTPRCGKSTLMGLLKRLAPKALASANITSPALFRSIETWHPTLLIDEADAFLHDKGELRCVLDSGHEREMAFTLRCVGDDHKPTRFSTWSPKVIAYIGRLHPTLEDRSIRIELRRKLSTETVERVPPGNPFLPLRQQGARWAQDNFDTLRRADPDLPEKLNDRARDNWRPLLAIADACGRDWPAMARQAAMELSAVDDDETASILLLKDLQSLFEAEAGEGGKNLSSAKVVEKLAQMESRPWPEFGRGKPITAHGVAKLLKPFGIRPRAVVVRGHHLQGYLPEQFDATWARYLPKGGGENL